MSSSHDIHPLEGEAPDNPFERPPVGRASGSLGGGPCASGSGGPAGAADPPSAEILSAGPLAAVGQNAQIMRAHHDRLLALCDRLEAIADSLPDHVDLGQCLHAARALVPAVRTAHLFEESVFFPMVRAALRDGDRWGTGGSERLAANIARLTDEHREDESFAEEVSEALLGWGLAGDRLGAETMGYMLRGLFETLRRHVAFEREVLLGPLAAHVPEA